MPTEWLAHIKKTTPEKGVITTKDNQENSLVIEWKRSDISSPIIAHFKNNISDLASEELTSSELYFLRKHPEAASQDLFLYPCIPLLENVVEESDWSAIEEKIQSTIKQFYSTDLAHFDSEILKPLMDDLYFFGTIQNEGSDQICGFFLFGITPALPFGSIKVINLVVRSKERDRGLEKAILSAVFKLIPQTNKLILFVRPTNEVALELYKTLEFLPDLDLFLDPNHKVNLNYFTPLEYRTILGGALQKNTTHTAPSKILDSDLESILIEANIENLE